MTVSWLTNRLRGDDGAALVITVAVAGMMLVLVSVSFAVALQSNRTTAFEMETSVAVAAAEAGIDDYLFRLNTQQTYWRYGAANPPPDGNLAFAQFVPVPGGASDGSFTYSVDASNLWTRGYIVLDVTGRAPGDERTVQAVFRKEGFLDYLYFTDKETADPIFYQGACTPVTCPNSTAPTREEWAREWCSHRRWDAWTHPVLGPQTGRHADCHDMVWVTNDRVDGPFHTNDTWRIRNRPTWNGRATGSTPIPGALYTGTGSPNYNAGPPAFHREQIMPPNNYFVRDQADQARGGQGCLFTGPTEIILQGTQLRVRSPYTRVAGAGCGTWPTTSAQTIPIPPNGTVYVQNIPTSASDPNYWATTPYGQGLGYPIPGDVSTYYDARSGDAFVEGNLDGALTIGAEHNIIITWDITYTDYSESSDDILGLIANDYVMVYKPVSASGSHMNALPNHNSVFQNPRIAGALIAIRQSFLVQNWGSGAPLGNIYVFGAVGQNYRGPLNTITGQNAFSGYDSNFRYDTRLRWMAPPNYVDPLNVRYYVHRHSEQYP